MIISLKSACIQRLHQTVPRVSSARPIPLRKYIPEFKGIKVAVFDEKADKTISGKEAPEYRLVDAHRPVTIHDLLTHTSGISGKAPGRTREIQHEGDTLATWIPIVVEGPLS